MKEAQKEKLKSSFYMASAVVAFLVGLACFGCAGIVAYAATYADGDGRIARLAFGMCFVIFGWLLMDFSSDRSDQALMHERRAWELLESEDDGTEDGQ